MRIANEEFYILMRAVAKNARTLEEILCMRIY